MTLIIQTQRTSPVIAENGNTGTIAPSYKSHRRSPEYLWSQFGAIAAFIVLSVFQYTDADHDESHLICSRQIRIHGHKCLHTSWRRDIPRRILREMRYKV